MQRLRLLAGLYEKALQEAPLRTKILTSGTILTSADLVRQLFFEEPRQDISKPDAPPTNFDAERTARMALFGLTIHPLWITGWFNFIDKWQGTLPAGASKGTVLVSSVRKMLIDQLTSSPVFVATFIGAMALMQGGFNVEYMQQKIAQDWWTTVKGAWSFWSVGHVVNFAFVPLHWRILYVNVLSAGWGMFLSKMQAKPLDSEEKVWVPIDSVFASVKTATGVDLDRPEAAVAVIGTCWAGLVIHSFTFVGACWGVFGGSLTLGIRDSLQQHQQKQGQQGDDAHVLGTRGSNARE
jgi:protein Mpv17